MNVSEQPPSKKWATLKYKGERFAEVCFEPDGTPTALTFRIPHESFRLPGVGQLLTLANLLKAVGVAADRVTSWRHDVASDAAGLDAPLPPPAESVAHLHVSVSLKQAAQTSESADFPEEKWQDLEARWNAIRGVEASIETLRISMDGLRVELEASAGRTLSPDEKVHALNSDVAQWTKAKGRATYALPKLRDFIHRANWAAGAPERKQLEELLERHVRPRVAFAELGQMMDRLDSLLKDRQVTCALGNSVYQECKSVATEVQGALRTVQGNAQANAAKKRGATAARGKSLR